MWDRVAKPKERRRETKENEGETYKLWKAPPFSFWDAGVRRSFSKSVVFPLFSFVSVQQIFLFFDISFFYSIWHILQDLDNVFENLGLQKECCFWFWKRDFYLCCSVLLFSLRRLFSRGSLWVMLTVFFRTADVQFFAFLTKSFSFGRLLRWPLPVGCYADITDKPSSNLEKYLCFFIVVCGQLEKFCKNVCKTHWTHEPVGI